MEHLDSMRINEMLRILRISLNTVEDSRWVIQCIVTIFKKSKNFESAIRVYELAKQLDHEPTFDDIATKLSKPEKEIEAHC